jgi:hypothetical protein
VHAKTVVIGRRITADLREATRRSPAIDLPQCTALGELPGYSGSETDTNALINMREASMENWKYSNFIKVTTNRRDKTVSLRVL